MATLTIQRTNEYINKGRDYKIFVNGEQIGTISNGKTKSFQVGSGQHSVEARIDWCSSPELSIYLGEKEERQIRVGGFKNGRLISTLTMIAIGLHFLLSFLYQINWVLYVAMPLPLIFVYYLSLGRKEYLSLEEI